MLERFLYLLPGNVETSGAELKTILIVCSSKIRQK